MSRPIKLTAALQAEILPLLADGAPLATACEAVGIHPDTLDNWFARGQLDEEPFASFLVEVKRARAKSELTLLAEARYANKDGGTGAQWILARTRGDRYRETQRHEHIGAGGGPITTLVIPADEQRALEVAQLLAAQGALEAAT